jgi:hypothetical protein
MMLAAGTAVLVFLWVVGGVLGLVALYVAYIVIGTFVTGAMGHRPRGIEVTVDAPSICSVGDVVELVVTVRDTLGRERWLHSVDFEDSYLRGFEVVRIEPTPSDWNAKPIFGARVHIFEATIPAGGAVAARFELRAAIVGEFAGEITVYVDSRGLRYETTRASTVVRASGS